MVALPFTVMHAINVDVEKCIIQISKLGSWQLISV